MNHGPEQNALQVRVASCLQVIHDVGQRLAREDVHPRIIEQLQRLDELLSLIDHQAITENDLVRIEVATNQLMLELGTLFSHKGLGTLYDRMGH